MTEGPEGHLYCRKNTETHKKTKKNKQTNDITQKILQLSIQYTVQQKNTKTSLYCYMESSKLLQMPFKRC